MSRRRLLRLDRGAATLAAMALCAVLACGLATVGQLGRCAIVSQRTSAAADLASLGAAVAMLRFAEHPCDEAGRIAASNATDLVSCSISSPAAGPEVVVLVRSADRVWPVGRFQEQSRAGLRVAGPQP